MTADGRPGAGRLTTTMLLIVLAGTPLVAFLWETLNRLFAGVFEPGRLLLAVPVAALFGVLLLHVRRTVQRWNGEPPAGVRP